MVGERISYALGREVRAVDHDFRTDGRMPQQVWAEKFEDAIGDAERTAELRQGLTAYLTDALGSRAVIEAFDSAQRWSARTHRHPGDVLDERLKQIDGRSDEALALYKAIMLLERADTNRQFRLTSTQEEQDLAASISRHPSRGGHDPDGSGIA
jgi:hypothetical protein